jgi:hypothetical protein
MDTWEQDYVDLVEPGFFEFGADDMGAFVFGAVQGWLDLRVSTKEPFLEYSWQGTCEGDELSGRGWFMFKSPDLGEGMIFIHCGDESGVNIERET